MNHLHVATAAELDALLSQTAKIDTSPFILSPFEAERKPAILPSSPGFRVHLITSRQVDATSPSSFHFDATSNGDFQHRIPHRRQSVTLVGLLNIVAGKQAPRRNG